MVSETTTYTLGDLVDLSQGLAINAKTSHLISGFGTPLLRITDLINGTRCQFVDVTKVPQQCVVTPEDIIYTRTGQVGLVFKGKRGVAHNNCFKVTPKPELLDSEYLYWFLSQESVRKHANAIASGSVQKDLNHTSFKSIPIELPCLKMQRAATPILNSIADKIELNRRMNATLEGMARALFQSWFVEFDPVRAKLDGRKPEGMDKATAALFPDAFQESSLGPVPKGWKAGTLVEGFNLTMGQSPPGDTYNEEANGLPFYQGRTDFGFRFPTRRIYCSAPTRYAKPGDTLVSVRAPVGDINMANEECCIGRGVAAVRHNSGSTSFTYHSMANLYPDFARFEAEGTVFGSINKDSFEKLRFIIPPTDIVFAYERQAGPLDEQIRTLDSQSQTLATLRDTLLPKLLSGELSVASIPKVTK